MYWPYYDYSFTYLKVRMNCYDSPIIFISTINVFCLACTCKTSLLEASVKPRVWIGTTRKYELISSELIY
jgi:hypothetical protein